MLLVPSITFYWHYNIWSCTCSTGLFQFRWLKGYIYSSCYYHHQIGSIHLSHCHIFRDCEPDMFVTSYSVAYWMYITGKYAYMTYIYIYIYIYNEFTISQCLRQWRYKIKTKATLVDLLYWLFATDTVIIYPLCIQNRIYSYSSWYMKYNILTKSYC